MMKSKRIDLVALAKKTMLDKGFEPTFSIETDHIIRYLSTQPEQLFLREYVQDLRHLPWSSIDNIDSQDLDQVEVIVPGEQGLVHLLVGIADVNGIVSRNSVFDLHAAINTTSVYTGVVTFPMLPEFLSYDRTSLLPDQDRQAIVVEMVLDPDGKIVDQHIYPALVRNKAKLVYEQVATFIDQADGSSTAFASDEIQKQLRLQDQYAQRLRKRRYDQGALDLETIEARAVTKDGLIVDLAVPSKNRARELIEDFMIAANSTVAQFLKQHHIPCIRRVVKEPKRWPRIVQLAGSLGHSLPDSPDSKALSLFLDKQKKRDPETFPDLSLSIVKLLGPGEYILDEGQEDMGHFGLAVADYTHSTAPNRRYPDLLTQRLLKAQLAKEPIPYTRDQLAILANRCTEQSNAVQKVERFMRKAAAAVFLQNRIGEIFQSIVTGASDKGTYVRLLHPPAEGRVVEHEKGLDVGDRVEVKLVRVSPYEGFIDFIPVRR